MGSVGLLGGTFDPPHFGHLAAAEEARYRLGLDSVLWIPAGSPPHKPGGSVTAASHRLAMVRAATAGNDAFTVDDVEMGRAGPSYSVHTLEELRARHPSHRLVFLMGADEFRALASWHAAARIPELCEIGVMARSGVSFDPLRVERAVPAVRGAYSVIEVPNLPISSSALRDRVRHGLPIRYLTPDAVCEYIASRGLYRPA